MNLKPEKTFEFIVEVRSLFTVQGNGRTEFEAQQDAIERYHRLQKSGDIIPDSVGKPKIIQTVP